MIYKMLSVVKMGLSYDIFDHITHCVDIVFFIGYISYICFDMVCLAGYG